MDEKLIVSQIIGGFGNQLFQYSTGYAMAKRTGSQLKLDLDFFDSQKFKNAWSLNKLKVDIEVANKSEIDALRSFKHKSTITNRIAEKLKLLNSNIKKGTHYSDSLGFKPDLDFLRIEAPKYLEGWFLKPLYFNSVYSDLVEMFVPKFVLSKEYFSWLEKINNSNSVSIHVRRNDYINNEVFLVLEIQYYRFAIDYIMQSVESPTFYVFSDDITWCKDNLTNIPNIQIVGDRNENSNIEDFLLMKECKHNIIANSSYSWWAAYLNQNERKYVVAPREWFHSGFFQESLESNQGFLMSWFQC